jgi:hypothetical protein
MRRHDYALDVLRNEFSFVQAGGYRLPPHGWKVPLIFEDSPICLRRDSCWPGRCALMEFVPAEAKSAKVPCRHIPLNELGETLDSLYRTATNHEIEDAVSRWLAATIAHLEGRTNRPAA